MLCSPWPPVVYAVKLGASQLSHPDLSPRLVLLVPKGAGGALGVDFVVGLALVRLRSKAHGAAEALALAGTPIDGFKLVTGRTYRKWSDDEAAIHAMALYTNESVMSRKPISPSKAIAMLGEKCDDVNALIVKPEGKPTLVPESDKRPAVPVADAFTVID